MLKQFLHDRDRKIEYLLAELDKAKGASAGGPSFRKYVQLKSQNAELQTEVETLAKKVGSGKQGQGQARGGRRGGAGAGTVGPSSSGIGAGTNRTVNVASFYFIIPLYALDFHF
jgi:hypothetical protein